MDVQPDVYSYYMTFLHHADGDWNRDNCPGCAYEEAIKRQQMVWDAQFREGAQTRENIQRLIRWVFGKTKES